MPSTAVSMGPAAPIAVSRFMNMRQAGSLTSSSSRFFVSRSTLVPRLRRACQPLKNSRQLSIKAISAPELGTPDAIAGTVCHVKVVRMDACTISAPSPRLGTRVAVAGFCLNSRKALSTCMFALCRLQETLVGIRTLIGLLLSPAS